MNKKQRSATAKRTRRTVLEVYDVYADQQHSPSRAMHTFGVGREAFNKVVSPSKHNY